MTVELTPLPDRDYASHAPDGTPLLVVAHRQPSGKAVSYTVRLAEQDGAELGTARNLVGVRELIAELPPRPDQPVTPDPATVPPQVPSADAVRAELDEVTPPPTRGAVAGYTQRRAHDDVARYRDLVGQYLATYSFAAAMAVREHRSTIPDPVLAGLLVDERMEVVAVAERSSWPSDPAYTELLGRAYVARRRVDEHVAGLAF